MDFVVLRPEGLEGINSIQKKLNKTIGLEFTGSKNFRTNKQNKEGKRFVGNFKTKNSKHRISGLGREKVYGCL